jgi:hypothetical protein
MSVVSAKVINKKGQLMSNGIEWVVTLKLEDGSTLRGVQVAWYGHPAMDFFAKRKGVKSISAWAEKKSHFDRFLEEGLRFPLTAEELA